ASRGQAPMARHPRRPSVASPEPPCCSRGGLTGASALLTGASALFTGASALLARARERRRGPDSFRSAPQKSDDAANAGGADDAEIMRNGELPERPTEALGDEPDQRDQVERELSEEQRRIEHGRR